MKLLKNIKDIAVRATAFGLIKDQAVFLKNISENTLNLDKSNEKMTFEMLPSMGITEKQIQEAKRAFYVLTIIFVVGACLLFIYFLYLLFSSDLLVAVVSFCVMMVFWAHAFKFHFWYYQIKRRKLGCTVQEWYRDLIKFR